MIRDEQARARIRDMSNTLQQHLAPSGPSSSSSTAAASAKAIQLQSANTVLALARFAVGAVQHAHSTLTRDGTADVAFASQTDSDSHDLDLQVLAIVLHGKPEGGQGEGRGGVQRSRLCPGLWGAEGTRCLSIVMQRG